MVQGARVFVVLGVWALLLTAGCGPQEPIGLDGFGGKGDGDQAGLQTSDFFLGALATGALPKGAEIDPDGRWLHVANMGEPTLTAIDLARLADWRQRSGARYFASDAPTRAALTSWLNAIGAGPAAAAGLELVDDPGLSTKIATPYGYRGAVVGNIEVVYLDRTDYVLSTQLERQVLNAGGQVTVIDKHRGQVTAEIPTGGRGSKIVAAADALDAAGRRVLYVSNWFSGDISVIDVSPAALNAEVASYTPGRLSPGLKVALIKLVSDHPKSGDPFPIAPRGIVFTRDGRYALVAGFNSKTLLVVDSQSHQQLAELAPVPAAMGPGAMRHLVLSGDGSVAYLSILGSNRVLRLDVPQLVAIVDSLRAGGSHQALARWRQGPAGQVAMLSAAIWQQIVIPWADGASALLVDRYGADHSRPASLRDKTFGRADPNTIVLDPRPGNRFLYVSCRTTKGWPPADGRYDWDGKIDVVDTVAGRVIFTLVSGPEPTGLTISPDGRTLVSTDYRANRARFYDVGALTDAYGLRPTTSR